MSPMVTTKKMVGLISGMVMCQKVWKVEAPSTLAASSTDSGIDWSPARKISMKVPIGGPGDEEDDGEHGHAGAGDPLPEGRPP